MNLLQIQPSIFPFGIRIDEPVTTFTDLMVTAVCFYAFFKLVKQNSGLKIANYLKFYFLSMAIATLFGGLIGHGFLYMFSGTIKSPEGLIEFLSKIFGEELFKEVANPWKLPGWITSMLSVSFIERTVIEHSSKYISKRAERFFKWANIIELLIFMTLTMLTLNFKFVEIHSAYGILIIVGSFSLLTYHKRKNEASRYFIIAVIITIFSSTVYITELTLHKWFNYLDLSHVLMTFAAYVFYLGSKRMIEENRKKPHYQRG